jgi:hypothetical protein
LQAAAVVAGREVTVTEQNGHGQVHPHPADAASANSLASAGGGVAQTQHRSAASHREFEQPQTGAAMRLAVRVRHPSMGDFFYAELVAGASAPGAAGRCCGHAPGLLCACSHSRNERAGLQVLWRCELHPLWLTLDRMLELPGCGVVVVGPASVGLAGCANHRFGRF